MTMTSLYVIFFLVALILFAAIAGLSWWQQKSKSQNSTSINDDMLGESQEGNSVNGVDTNLRSATGVIERDQPRHAKSTSVPTLNDSSELQNSSPSNHPKEQAQVFDVSAPAKTNAINKVDTTHKNISLESVSENTMDAGSAGKSNRSHAKGMPRSDANGALITELVARVQNPEPIEQHDLLSLFREYDFKFQRKVHIFGLNQLTEEWCDIEYELPSARFVELGLSIELADPRGAMDRKESHDFQQMTLELTNRFNANFEFSMGLDAAAEQAQLLDQIGQRFDSMAVLNVVPKSKTGFRIADIESCARDLMMSTDKNGIFMKTQGHKHDLEVLYRLACTDGTGQFGIVGGGAAANGAPVHDLVIYMNVPATNGPDLVFQEMIKDANSLATWLDGRVVDKNGRAVSQRSYTALMKQITDIADGMREQGLSPGDAVSRKLF